jgi:methionyl aminopeptidase
MNHLKTAEQIAQMRKAGLLVWEAHQIAAAMVRPGVTTGAINATVEDFLAANNATPLFKGVPGVVPFPAAACISVNQEVVHGIPGHRVLRDGDIVSIDIGVKRNGWCGDAAVTHPVGSIDPVAQRLLDVTEETLRLAIGWMTEKRRWSQVARELEKYARSAGFAMAEGLAGHSIGRAMWEGLHLPNHSSLAYERTQDFTLEPGLVVAVEPMVNAGTGRVKTLADHWTVVTEDGLPSAHFEHTIALTRQGPAILTAGPEGQGWAITV